MTETSADLARPPEPQVDAHEQGDRDGHGDREDAPRALAERVHHHQGEDRHDDDHDRQRGDQGGEPADETQFLAGHLPQRAPAAAHREEQHEVVLHGPGQDDAHDDPQRAGQVTPLRREYRPDQRAGAGDRREVVAVEHTPVHRHVVLAVLVVLGRRRAPVVRLRDALLDVGRVEAVGDEVGADGGEDEPDRVDRLAADQGDHHPRQAAQQRDADPHGDAQRCPPPPLLVEDLRVDGGRRQIRIDRDAARLVAGPIVRGQCHRALRGPGAALPDAPALLQGP